MSRGHPFIISVDRQAASNSDRRLLDTEYFYLGAFSTWSYSSSDVAAIDLLDAQSSVRFIDERKDWYEEVSIYNLVCGLLWTFPSVLLSWLLLSSCKSVFAGVSPLQSTQIVVFLRVTRY